jgi:hypothetical protein
MNRTCDKREVCLVLQPIEITRWPDAIKPLYTPSTHRHVCYPSNPSLFFLHDPTNEPLSMAMRTLSTCRADADTGSRLCHRSSFGGFSPSPNNL